MAIFKSILVTTSRRPSRRTRSLVKDLMSLVPNSLRVTRGHLTMEDLALLAVNKDCNRILLIGERRGNPSIIRVYEILQGGIYKNIVSIKIIGLSLSREIKRPLPSFKPKVLYVKAENDNVSDFAEAFMLGFNARLYYDSVRLSKSSLMAVLKIDKENKADALLEFIDFKNDYIGPKLRLKRVKEMIKK